MLNKIPLHMSSIKLAYFLAVITLLYPSISDAQQSDIASFVIYRKVGDSWKLWSKNEFIRTHYVQSNINYRWMDDQWQRASIQTRELSLNQDTMQTFIINYNSDPHKRVYVTKCYKVRNEAGEQTDVIFEMEGKLYPSWVTGRFTPLDSLPGGLSLAYPYQFVFQEAERLMALDEAIENIKPTYQFCRESQRTDEVFTLSVNEDGRLISFESDSSKVLVMYKNKDGGQNSGNNFIQVYPNPFSDEIFISINGANLDRMDVLNYLGEIVFSSDIPANKPFLQINLSHIPAGVYVVNAVSGTATYSTKVLKIN